MKRTSWTDGAAFGRAARVVAIVVVATTSADATMAQSSLIDGYTFGVGLSLYGGDLDGVPTGEAIAYLASSSINVHAGVDRYVGPIQARLETHYNRVSANNEFVTGDHNLVSVDVLAAYGVGGADQIRFYAGLGPTVAIHQYKDLSAYAVTVGWAEEGNAFAMTIPIGVIFQDSIRLGVRIPFGDALDGRDGGSGTDKFGMIAVTYRFRR